MACPGGWTLTGFVPDADFSELPALYGRPIEAGAQGDRRRGWQVRQQPRSRTSCTCEVLGSWFDLGFFNWFSTRKPLNSLADLKDMKLRSPGGVLISWRIHYFGAIPNVTAWPDVPLAMSQGTFDGLISSNESCNSSKLYDSGLRHSLQDRQGMGLYVPLVNQDFWSRIGPKLQETVLALWSDNLPAWRANTAKAQENARTELTSHGVTFVDVAQADLDAIHGKMLSVQDKAVQDAHITPDLVKMVMADVGV